MFLGFSHEFCVLRRGLGCSKQDKILTGEHTTLRHHAAAVHSVSNPVLSIVLSFLLVLFLGSLPKVVYCK